MNFKNQIDNVGLSWQLRKNTYKPLYTVLVLQKTTILKTLLQSILNF